MVVREERRSARRIFLVFSTWEAETPSFLIFSMDARVSFSTAVRFFGSQTAATKKTDSLRVG